MKLTVFQSDKGDCLLLTGGDEKTRVLIDGGMSSSYREHVAATLGKVHSDGGKLDVVYVSHIDQDHISGVLALLDDEVAWRAHEFQLRTGNDEHPEPKAPRPPVVEEIWHNGFRDQLEDNVGPIAEMLAASASVLSGGERAGQRELADGYQNLASGVRDGLELGRRVSAEQLGIPLNPPFGGKLAVLAEKPKRIQRGSLRFSLLAPRQEDVEALRETWNEWLADNQAALARLRAQMQADIERLGTNEVEVLRSSLQLQADELGDRSKVTTPNLASLMFLVEEEGKSVLLTGDGHAREVLSGLEDAGKLRPGETIHVEVLKVPHHGSEFNLDTEFCRRVTADDYIFCANGEHANPDLRVLEMILDSRLATASGTDSDEDAGGDFRFWFNSSSTVDGADAEHMVEVERLVKERADESERFSFSFLTDHFFELEI
ncbi:MAG: MBL fold metallo-hydrolase [Solirubrobacterales bacterium]